MSKVIYICSTCGSDKTSREASTRWNLKSQQWDILEILDTAICQECGEECSLQEVELKNPHYD